jgi:hypothetical protein
MFSYYDEPGGTLKGKGNLNMCTQISGSGDLEVYFTTPERVWHFKFRTSHEKEFWIKVAKYKVIEEEFNKKNVSNFLLKKLFFCFDFKSWHFFLQNLNEMPLTDV